MNLLSKLLTLALLNPLFISCDQDAVESKDAQEEAKAAISSREISATSGREEERPREAKTSKMISELKELTDKEAKRDLFSELILELPPEDHDLAVEAVIDDLNSEDPTNLVVEYLELSSLMSPALQLPGMARILAEKSLLPLQRVAMVQQLREDLEIPDEQTVQDWRPLVEAYLRKDKTIIPE